jgi:hypothetical protein
MEPPVIAQADPKCVFIIECSLDTKYKSMRADSSAFVTFSTALAGSMRLFSK